MLTVLTVSALRWMDDQRRRAALRRLLDHDDRMLADIGLRRAEIEAALRLPQGSDLMGEARRRSAHALRLDCQL